MMILGIPACLSAQTPPKGSGGGPQAIPVQIVSVREVAIQDSSELMASLDPKQFASLRPQVNGQISQVFVKLGDRVKEGDPIVQITAEEQTAALDSRMAAMGASAAAVETAQAAFKADEAELVRREADLTFRQSQYERQKQLADRGAVSQSTLDQFRWDVEQAAANVMAQKEVLQSRQAAITQAKQLQQQAEAEAQQQKVQLRYFQVNAPFSGTLGEVRVKAGDYVTPQSELTTLIEDGPLELKITVPLEFLPRLQIGTPLEILDPAGKALGKTTISFIAPEAEAGSQGVLVRAIYQDPQGLLRANQFVRIRILWDQQLERVIPLTAVSRLAGQSFVFVASPSLPEACLQGRGAGGAGSQAPSLFAIQKPVQLGRIHDNDYILEEGLDPKERIVASGLQKLFPCAPILDESVLPQGSAAG
jgi:RND family efflux transporter MFP subunit